jgi:SPP1 family predicted phage head-tail adaptor
MLIAASKLRHRITVQRKDRIRDAFGDPVVQWTDVCTVWAEVVDRTGKQVYDTEQDIDAVTTRVRIRFRTDIEPQMRVVYNGNFYEIHAVMDLNGRGDFIELVCQRGVNDG